MPAGNVGIGIEDEFLSTIGAVSGFCSGINLYKYPWMAACTVLTLALALAGYCCVLNHYGRII